MPRPNNRDDEERQKIDDLYGLLKEEGMRDCLSDMEKRTTCHTPVHEAAAAGMSHLALEVANLKPSLARKLNHEGLSPMHLALRHSHVQTVRALMVFDSSLIRVKGRNLVTPLHYAAELGETELLAEFLSACPSSVEDLTCRYESVMHVAVRNKRSHACKVLFRWMIRKNLAGMLNWRDEDGNTVLHIAALTNQPEVMKLLIKHVKVNAKNFAGLTALDLCYVGEGQQLDLNVEVRKILCDAKAKRASEVSDSLTVARCLVQIGLSMIEKWDQRLGLTDAKSRAKYRAKLRDMTLVVAVLIATATYQSVLSPPGGFWQDSSTTAAAAAVAGRISYAPSPAMAAVAGGRPLHTAGTMIMSGPDRVNFIVLNTLAFVSSVAVIVLTLLGVESAYMLTSPVYFAMATYILAVKQATASEVVEKFSPTPLVVVFVVYLAAFWFLLVQRMAPVDVRGRPIGGFI